MNTERLANQMMGAAYLRQGQLALGKQCYGFANVQVPKELLVECGHVALRRGDRGGRERALEAFTEAGAQSALREMADDCLASSDWSHWLTAKVAYETLHATDKLGELGRKWMTCVMKTIDETGANLHHAGKSPDLPIACLAAAQLHNPLKKFAKWLLGRQEYELAIQAFGSANATADLIKLGDQCVRDVQLDRAFKAYRAANAIEHLQKLINLYLEKRKIKEATEVIVSLCAQLSLEALTAMLDPVLKRVLDGRYIDESEHLHSIRWAFRRIAEHHAQTDSDPNSDP